MIDPPDTPPARTTTGAPACEFCHEPIVVGHAAEYVTAWQAPPASGSTGQAITRRLHRFTCRSCWPSVRRGIDPAGGDAPSLFETPTAPNRGRTRRDAPAHVHAHADRVDAAGQRAEIAGLLADARGTSKDLAADLAVRYGAAAPIARTNQIGTRLGELYAEHRAAPLRSTGHCWHGICGDRPTDSCDRHGALQVRDGATVWTATDPADRPAHPQPELR